MVRLCNALAITVKEYVKLADTAAGCTQASNSYSYKKVVLLPLMLAFKVQIRRSNRKELHWLKDM